MISCFLQTCPQRRLDRLPTIQSLQQSDVGDRFTVVEHPDGVGLHAFFGTFLEAMAAAKTDYVIRFEDDVLVNRHILHNVVTWPALADPLFGAGWLFVPEIAFGVAKHVRSSRGIKYRNTPEMWAALAIVLPTKLVPLCLDELKQTVKADQDLVISRAVWKAGKRCFFHEPVLAENRDPVSAVGTRYPRGTTKKHLFAGRLFSADWKRPVTTTSDPRP